MFKLKIGFAVIAIILAVSAFAFTTRHKATVTEPELHWYFVNSSGIIVGEVVDDQKYTRSEIFLYTGCVGQTGIDCARGYTTPKMINTPAPPVTLPQERVKKD